MEPQRRIGALGGKVTCGLRRHLGESDQALAGADQLLQRRELVLERAPDHVFNRMLELPAIDNVGHQHRAVIGCELHPVARQQMRG